MAKSLYALHQASAETPGNNPGRWMDVASARADSACLGYDCLEGYMLHEVPKYQLTRPLKYKARDHVIDRWGFSRETPIIGSKIQLRSRKDPYL